MAVGGRASRRTALRALAVLAVLGSLVFGGVTVLTLEQVPPIRSVLPQDLGPSSLRPIELGELLKHRERVFLLVDGGPDPASAVTFRRSLTGFMRFASPVLQHFVGPGGGGAAAARPGEGYIELVIDAAAPEAASPFALRDWIEGRIADMSARFSERTGKPAPRVRAWGEALLAAANIEAVVADTLTGFLVIAVVLLVLARLVLGRFRTLLLPLLASASGAGLAAGLLVLAGAEVHPMTLGYAFGMSYLLLDPAVYLLHELRAAGPGGGSWREAWYRVARPAATGLGVSAGLFGLLTTSSFPGLALISQAALLTLLGGSCVGLLLARAFNWFGDAPVQPRWLLCLERMLGGGQSAMDGWLARLPGPGRLLGAAIAVVLAAGAWLVGARVQVMPDPQRLGYDPPELCEVRDRLELARPGCTHRSAIAVRPAVLPELKQLIKQTVYVSEIEGELQEAGTDDRGLRWVAVPVHLMREESGELLQRRLDLPPFTGQAYLLSSRLAIGRVFRVLQTLVAGRLLVAVVAIALLLPLLLWSVRRGLAAALPLVLGLGLMLAVHAVAGVPLTVVSLIGLTIVIGVAVNHGVLVALAPAGEALRPARAVATSGLATLAGYSAMAFARNGAVRGIGLSTALAVGFGLLVALFLVPALLGTVSGREES